MATKQTKTIALMLSEKYPSVELKHEGVGRLVIYCRDCQSTQTLRCNIYDGPYALLEDATEVCNRFHSLCKYVAPAEDTQLVPILVKKRKEQNVIAATTERQKRAIALD